MMMPHSERKIADQMVARLTADLSPSVLKIEDVSWQHAGHAVPQTAASPILIFRLLRPAYKD